MKKSTIIKYLELQGSNLDKIEAKNEEIRTLRAAQNAEVNDEKFEELDNDIEFCIMERSTYQQENERIADKLIFFRKESKENKAIFREANAEYKATLPEQTDFIQLVPAQTYSADQARMDRIYSGKD